MKKYILILLISLFGAINLGVTEKYKPVASFEISKVTADYSKLTPYIPLFQQYTDSIPTVDQFGRVRNGIIVDGIVSVMNTDPSGVKLTELEVAYVRSLVGGLYLAGSWQKMKACYGFVGGNAWKHKWNWKDMRDLDAAFRLSFLGGGWIHSSTGAKPNGTSSYANTFLNPALFFTNSTHLSFTTNENTITSKANSFEVGSFSVNDYLSLVVGRQNRDISYISSPIALVGIGQSYNTIGTTIGSYSTSDSFLIQGGLSKSITRLNQGANMPNENINISAIGTSQAPTRLNSLSSLNVQVVTIGTYLTQSEAIQTSNAVTYSQGILNRN